MDEDNIGLSVDLIVHFGFIKNIDLWQQGIYCLQITLLAGRENTLVAPIGIFSAPSRLIHMWERSAFQRWCQPVYAM